MSDGPPGGASVDWAGTRGCRQIGSPILGVVGSFGDHGEVFAGPSFILLTCRALARDGRSWLVTIVCGILADRRRSTSGSRLEGDLQATPAPSRSISNVSEYPDWD